MASKKPVRPDSVQAANKSGKEARDAFEFDLNRRLHDQKKILSADDLSGLYDPKRQLFTTIDGKPRPLTFDDLLAFRAAVNDTKKRSKGKKYLGGIKPKQVIDLSRKEDRDRAHKEIHTAMPVTSRGGIVHFQTNSGPNSEVQRHHVFVEFMNYSAVVASPVPAMQAVKEMLTGNVKYDCDCQRHTFWFRFICTIGGFNYGRSEDGFPRVRNPKLYGVACKHVIRVMTMASQSSTLKNYAAKMVENGRKTLTNKKQAVKIADMDKFAEQLKKESWQKRAVKSTDEKKSQREAQPSYQRQRAAQKAQSELKKAAALKPAAGKVTNEAKQIALMMQSFGWTQEQAQSAIAASKAVK